ncbi:MAG: glycosyltransferase family 4 protein [Paracoccaceae bacterium]
MAHKAPDTDHTMRRFAVLGEFAPSCSKTARHASALAVMLENVGRVITAAEPGSYARISLEYRAVRFVHQTRKHLAKEIPPGSQVILYTQAFNTGNIDQPLWLNWRKEMWRRLRLNYISLRRARKVTVVFGGVWPTKWSFWLTLGITLAVFFTAPSRLRVTHIRRPVAQVYARITGKNPPDIATDITTRIFTLSQSMRKQRDTSQLSPMWLLNFIKTAEMPAKIQTELWDILHIAMPLELWGNDILHRSGTTFQLSPPDKLAFANETAPGNTLSRFANHYRLFAYDVGYISRVMMQDDRQFLRWYIEGERPMKSIPPLPISPQNMAAYSPSKPRARSDSVGALLKYAKRCHSVDYIDKNTLSYLREPINGQQGNISRMELICALRAGLKTNAKTRYTPWQSQAIRTWFAADICTQNPAFQTFSTQQVSPQTMQPCLQIVGVITGQTGLAQNARMSARTFQSLGITTHSRDSKSLASVKIHAAQPPEKNLHRHVILHHINAEALPKQLLAQELAADNPIHIGYLLWELESVPQSHMLANDLLDEIWVPSEYLREIYQQAFGREILNIGKSIALPQPEPFDLAPYGLNDTHHIFLCIFDAQSSTERKNPLAAVRAFLAAFRATPHVRMIVKTTQHNPVDWGDPNRQMQEIQALAAKDPRIIIDTRHLPFRDLLALINRADCIVSPHRAEGFGYIPAYALNFAKPLIVTDYSGSQDFCTLQTSYPISYKMIPTKPRETIFNITANWADVDISEMAAAMLDVLENPEIAQAKAARGQALIRKKYGPKAHAARYLKRLKALGALS